MNKSLKVSTWIFVLAIFGFASLFSGIYLSLKTENAKAFATYSSIWLDNATAWNESVESAGTKDKPYLIDTPAQLAQLAKNVNSGIDYHGVYFQLRSNIDLSGHNWVPIGNEANPFKGIFYGAGKTISNMTVDATRMNATSTDGLIDLRNFRQYLGLFGYVDNNGTGADATTVNQITFENAYINACEYTQYAGVLAGYYNGIALENITINEIAGENTNAGATILFQLSEGSSMSANFTVGGLVGKLGTACTMNTSNSGKNEMATTINANVYNLSGNKIYIGGLVGENAGTIKESRRTSGEIKAYIGTIGGIVGRNTGTVLDCYNAGKILIDPNLPASVTLNAELNGAEQTFIGGLVGENSGGTVKTQNFNAVFGGISSQNEAQIFQTCRGSIGGIVGFNRGTIESVTNNAFVKCTGDDVQFMGGICALNAGIVRSSINMGTVGSDGSSNFLVTAVGGIVGINDGTTQGNGSYGQGQGYVYGSQNSGVVGQDIVAMYAGGIAGVNAYITTGDNISAFESGAPLGVVKNSGLISASTYSGGIVGWNFGSVYGAYNEGTVKATSGATNAIVGGVVGASGNGRFNNCFNVGEVGTGSYVGGFVGQLYGGSIKTIIRNCANYGNVTGDDYAGGFAGYVTSGDIQYGFTVSKVSSTSSETVRGGVVGYVATVDGDSSRPSANVSLNNLAYSSSIANYVNDVFGVTDNGMTAVGNFKSMFGEYKYDSYSLTLPKVDTMRGNQYYSFYKVGDMGAETENTNWYFEAGNNDNDNKYYYPILRLFKMGETNSLDVYGSTASAMIPTGGLEYPSERIYKVTFTNNVPFWNGTSKDHNKEVICDPQYVVRGHCVSEPTGYTIPEGFTMQWKQSDSDMLTDATDWTFDIAVNKNLNLFIEWTEKRYAIQYYLQTNGAGEFEKMTTEEVAFFGLNTSSTFSINPDAMGSLNLINVNSREYGYAFDGWWISDTASGIGASLEQSLKGTAYSLNKAFPEDIIYVYGTKTAEQYTVYLYAGRSNSNTILNFNGMGPNEAKTVTLTYNEPYDLSSFVNDIDYDPSDMSFKGWFNQEGSGGTPYTGSDSCGIFNITGTQQIRFWAQWTDKMQRVTFVSIDDTGTRQTLATIEVPYESIVTQQQMPNIVYYVVADRNGYQVDRYYTDESYSAEFDFNTQQIVEPTTVYVTWVKKKFTLRLNADGGVFNEGEPNQSDVWLIENVEYKYDFLNNILNHLVSSQLPTKMGYKVSYENGASQWNMQADRKGLRISEANANNLMPAYDLNIYIMWDVEQYQVELVANGGLYQDGSTVLTILLDYQTPLKDALDNYFATNNLPTQTGYGFRYWSLNNSGQDGQAPAEITNNDRVPYQGTRVYATWGKQFTVTFQKVFYNDTSPWLVVNVFEGDSVSAPDTSVDGFAISGMDFVEWKRFVGIIKNDNGEDEPQYETYDWLDPVTEDIILVGTWTPNGETTTPVDTSNILIISVSIIAGIVVLLFIFILARSRKKGLAVNNKRLQTKNSKEKLEELREIEERRRNDNPFE